MTQLRFSFFGMRQPVWEKYMFGINAVQIVLFKSFLFSMTTKFLLSFFRQGFFGRPLYQGRLLTMVRHFLMFLTSINFCRFKACRCPRHRAKCSPALMERTWGQSHFDSRLPKPSSSWASIRNVLEPLGTNVRPASEDCHSVAEGLRMKGYVLPFVRYGRQAVITATGNFMIYIKSPA